MNAHARVQRAQLMSNVVNLFVMLAASLGLSPVSGSPSSRVETLCLTGVLVGHGPALTPDAVLGFVITEGRFQAFRRVASHRKFSRLEILPGFPEDPDSARAVEELERDAATRARLTQENLTARDYVLTA